MSPFNLSGTLQVGGGSLVPYSLSGSPVIKQFMQIVTMVPGQGGRFQSVCFPSSGESGHPCFVPEFRGNAFNISSLRIMLAVGLSYMAFIMLRYVLSMLVF